jgi:hypothetical protein
MGIGKPEKQKEHTTEVAQTVSSTEFAIFVTKRVIRKMTASSSKNNRKKEQKRKLERPIGVIFATRKAIPQITVSKTLQIQVKAKAQKERVNLKGKARVDAAKGKAAKEKRKADVPMGITQPAIPLKQPTMLIQLHPALAGVSGIQTALISKKKGLHLQNGKTTTFLPWKRIQTNPS